MQVDGLCGSLPRGLLLRGREHAGHSSGRMYRLRGLRAGCPVEAIKPDTESGAEKWLSINAQYAKLWPNITLKNPPPTPKSGRECRTRLNISHQILGTALNP